VRRRRPDVDPDGAQPEALGRDIARIFVLVVPEMVVRYMRVRVRRGVTRRGR
jgi:hypothetical protein